MEPFKKITGVVAALNRVNVDTDQIIPAKHLKRIEKTGFGPFLFESWGKNADGTPNPDFELNAPSFADIFHKNCFENALVPVILPEPVVDGIMARANELTGYELTVDLETCEVSDSEGFRASFVVHQDPATHEFRRYCMLNGLDEIGLTMEHANAITAYEKARS